MIGGVCALEEFSVTKRSGSTAGDCKRPQNRLGLASDVAQAGHRHRHMVHCAQWKDPQRNIRDFAWLPVTRLGIGRGIFKIQDKGTGHCTQEISC
jgi:hypothetical protein